MRASGSTRAKPLKRTSRLVGAAVSVGVLEVDDVGGGGDQQAALPGEHAGDLLQAVGEDAGPVRAAVPIAVFQQADAASGLLAGIRIVREIQHFSHEDASPGIEGHLDRVHHVRLGGKQLHPEVGMNPACFAATPGGTGAPHPGGGRSPAGAAGTHPATRSISEGQSPAGWQNHGRFHGDRRRQTRRATAGVRRRGVRVPAAPRRSSGELHKPLNVSAWLRILAVRWPHRSYTQTTSAASVRRHLPFGSSASHSASV